MTEQPTTLAVSDAEWNTLDANIEVALKESITIAFLGSASCGKDSAIRCLFGVDFGEVSPIPGSTKELRAITLGADGECVIINAPGFGDRDASVDAIARQVLEQLDIVVYLVNSEGGVTIDEKTDFDQIRQRSEDAPTLVCINKIDLIREHQRDVFVEACCKQLGVKRADVVETSFDPLPQLFDKPVGVNQVIAWLNGTLAERGKYLILAKQLANKREACRPIIDQAAREALMAGAIPVPGADMTAVTLIQIRMIQNIAAVLEVKIDRNVILWILGELLGNTSKGVLRWGLNALKSAGWIPGGQVLTVATSALGGAMAAAMTKGVGHAVVEFLIEDGNSENFEKYQGIFQDVSSMYMDFKSGKFLG